MTIEEYNRKGAEIDTYLAAHGLGGEWGFILGIMLGRLSNRLGGWDKVDTFLVQFVALCKAGSKLALKDKL